MKKEIKIGNQTIRIQDRDGVDYLSLTDLAKLVNKDTSRVLSNWISMVRTLEFLDIWEKNYNPDYDQEAFQKVRMKAGVPSFFFSVKQWIEKTNAKGIESKAGRTGGTYAHHLIALEFCSTMSSEFRFMVYREYTELKQNEVDGWLKTHEFYLQKIEDNALENNRLSKDMQETFKKRKKLK